MANVDGGEQLRFIDATQVKLQNSISFRSSAAVELASISHDGIMRFTVDANDENAAMFVDCIESVLKKRLTGIDVELRNTSELLGEQQDAPK